MASDKISAPSSSSLHTFDFDLSNIENVSLLSPAELELMNDLPLPSISEIEGVHIRAHSAGSLESGEVSGV